MKWIIVTGDSGGLGISIVNKILLDNKCGVIGMSRSENEQISELKSRFPNQYIHMNFDLVNIEMIRQLYLSQIKKIGPIYGLVNNSAYAYDDIITNLNISMLETMYKINVFAPMALTKIAIRDMLLNNTKGSIVHITSVSAHTGYKGLSMYASTKGALEAFSRGIAREWGEKQIRSNCVSPGFMETAMSEELTSDQKNRIYGRTSLKSATSKECVASTVSFLLSEKAESITGSVIDVDCGTI